MPRGRSRNSVLGKGGLKFRWTKSANAIAQRHILGVLDIDFVGVHF